MAALICNPANRCYDEITKIDVIFGLGIDSDEEAADRRSRVRR
jgi:hypothetical protein